MRLWAGFLLLIFGIPLSWAIEIDQADSATVLILLYDKEGNGLGSGSGFFVTDAGHILTNAHVVADPNIDTIRILGKSMPPYPGSDARIVWVIRDHDAAVLKATKPSAVEPLALLLEKPGKGDKVWALGYPAKQIDNMETFGESLLQAFDATLTSGIVSRIFEGSGDNKYPLIQHTAEISAGNSGGALLDECGIVVGINTFGTVASDKKTDDPDFFAIGSDGLLKLLSPRIVGLKSIEKCNLEEPQNSEVQIEVLEPVEAEDSPTPIQVEELQAPSSANESLIWLSIVLMALGCGYLYIRKKSSVSSHIPLPLRPGAAHPTEKRIAEASRTLFRMSGFDERGAPVSFAFEARAPYSDRGFIIGRSLDFADFKIAHKNISRAHLQVKLTKTICLIRDLGSANGTSVNGVKLKPFEYIKVSFGDEICIATCTLTITS